jgi:hypothetical protein
MAENTHDPCHAPRVFTPVTGVDAPRQETTGGQRHGMVDFALSRGKSTETRLAPRAGAA